MSDKVIKLKDLEAERVLVAGVLSNKDRTDKIMLEANSHKYFNDTSYKLLFKIASKARVKHNSLVTSDLVSNYLESFGIKQDTRLKYLKLLDELKKQTVTDAEFAFALHSVKEAFVSRSVADTLARATDVLQKKGGSRAFEILDKKLYDLKLNIVDANYMTFSDVRKVDEFADLLKDVREHPEKFKGIPCGWSTLDTLTGGFQPQEYAMIIAKSGSGKSMAMINWANHAQKLGYNVVYVSLEMPDKVIRMRQLALESGIPFLNIKTQNLGTEQLNRQEETLRENISKRSGAFYVMDVPKCTVGLIEAQLRQISESIKIDMVFVDYMGLLKPESHVKSSQGWEVAMTISNDLRDLARTLKVTVITANQVTTEGMKKRADDDLEIEDVAISRRIVDPADTVIGLIWDKSQPHEMRMCVPKCRGGRIQSARLFCDLDVCKIADFNENGESFVTHVNNDTNSTDIGGVRDIVTPPSGGDLKSDGELL